MNGGNPSSNKEVSVSEGIDSMNPIDDSSRGRHLSNDNCQSAYAYCLGGSEPLPLCDTRKSTSDGAMNLWGWSNLIQGSDAIIECPLYVGAPDCDTEKATLVGTVTVDAGRSEIAYNVSADSRWSLSQLSLYVGHQKLPWDASDDARVPSAYPIQEHLVGWIKTATVQVEAFRLQSDRYVVAHARVCNGTPPAAMSTL